MLWHANYLKTVLHYSREHTLLPAITAHFCFLFLCMLVCLNDSPSPHSIPRYKSIFLVKMFEQCVGIHSHSGQESKPGFVLWQTTENQSLCRVFNRLSQKYEAKSFFFLKCGCLSLSAQYVYVSFEKAGARFTDEKGLCWRGLSHLCKKETCCVSHINVLTKAYIVGLIISGNWKYTVMLKAAEVVGL